MPTSIVDNRGLLEALLGNGRFLLKLVAVSLIISGGFAIAQSVSGQLLPHDTIALGMDAAKLTHTTNPNVVRFMFHDRVAFGGVLIALGIVYWWLVEFPLSWSAEWAWWTLAFSGAAGFLSFLAYLGYGYLDTWHGVATLFLLPTYLAGMWRVRKILGPLQRSDIWRTSENLVSAPEKYARWLLAACSLGLITAGITIVIVGMSFVFVPQDIAFMGLNPSDLQQASPLLIPILAHDRAGFGGGLISMGLTLLMIVRHAPLSRSLVQLIALVGMSGFGAAIGVHWVVGYTSASHLAPAYAGFVMFLLGAGLLAKSHTVEVPGGALAARHS